MIPEHEHEWRCFKDDKAICKKDSCNTIAKIDGLIAKAFKRGYDKGVYETFERCLTNGWLREAARTLILRAYNFKKQTKETKGVPLL